MMIDLVASIPSPPGNAIQLGPLNLRAYGAMIGLGMVAAIWIAQRRWARRGGDPEDVVSVVLWAVPAGVVGARFYHVVTDLSRFEGHWWRVVAIWEGGLGIFGGLVAGVATGLWVARRRGMPLLPLLDVAAPSLPVAQAIGRWGNWFNQELFGRPTDLPWALEIDQLHRPRGMAEAATYHPTFLYESLWNLSLAALLLWIASTGRLRPGRLFACYAAGYATGRILVESFRIDPTQELGGIRVNFLVAGTVLLTGLTFMVADLLRGRPEGTSASLPEPAGTEPPGAEPAETGPDEGREPDEVGPEPGPGPDETGPDETASVAADDAGESVEVAELEPVTASLDSGAEPM